MGTSRKWETEPLRTWQGMRTRKTAPFPPTTNWQIHSANNSRPSSPRQDLSLTKGNQSDEEEVVFTGDPSTSILRPPKPRASDGYCTKAIARALDCNVGLSVPVADCCDLGHSTHFRVTSLTRKTIATPSLIPRGNQTALLRKFPEVKLY